MASVLHELGSGKEIAAKCILSKVQKRIYVCSLAGTLLADDGRCHIHGEEECVDMYIDYRETLGAIERGL